MWGGIWCNVSTRASTEGLAASHRASSNQLLPAQHTLYTNGSTPTAPPHTHTHADSIAAALAHPTHLGEVVSFQANLIDVLRSRQPAHLLALAVQHHSRQSCSPHTGSHLERLFAEGGPQGGIQAAKAELGATIPAAHMTWHVAVQPCRRGQGQHLLECASELSMLAASKTIHAVLLLLYRLRSNSDAHLCCALVLHMYKQHLLGHSRRHK
jgi:hypothetical protein